MDTTKVRLNSGYDCPFVGLGAGGLATGGFPKGEVVKRLVKEAVEVGYRHFDTASKYDNEVAIGQALNDVITKGLVKREDIFLTTKIFSRYDNDIKGRAQAVNAIRFAIEKLDLTYIDLLLLHNPTLDPELDSEIWKGLEDSVNEGLVKSIGVSNFNLNQLKSLIKNANTIPAVNQVESHPKQSQRQLIEFCTQNGIHLMAFSPLGGVLVGQLSSDPIIAEIARNHNKSSAQVMLRWQIQRGIAVIPKTTRKEGMIENINVFDFSLTDSEMKAIEDMK